MEDKKVLNDPLGDIDPLMEKAFAVNESNGFTQNSLNLGQESPVSEVQFPTLNSDDVGKKVEEDVFSNIPVRLSVELGRSQISLKEVFELTEGSIIELERLVGEPLDLVVNGQVIAQGEVVAIDNNYGFRVTNIVSSVKK
jgi:flagellar motor switch protein FliN